MAALWVVGEVGADGGSPGSRRGRDARPDLGEAAGHDVAGIVVAADPAAAAAELATTSRSSWRSPSPRRGPGLVDGRGRPGRRSRREADPPEFLVGAGADGRDVAGALSALTGLGVLVNATAVGWTDAARRSR